MRGALVTVLRAQTFTKNKGYDLQRVQGCGIWSAQPHRD